MLDLNTIYNTIKATPIADLDFDWLCETANECRRLMTLTDDHDKSHDYLECAEVLEDLSSRVEKHLEETELDFETEQNKICDVENDFEFIKKFLKE